ncbi:MAG: hydantoinase/oxoprolinase family protein [Gammaproteobacteria bacterium]|nr:hydantoinase/oxoprolinase family protein [Gammaproteobacteria bacterium]
MTKQDKGHRIAIDVGGTFVDFVLLDESTGEITLEKQPSTPAHIVEEVGTGLGRLPVDLADVDKIFHGTTVALNTIVQEKGVKVGLLTTVGFRDVLEIGRGSRPEIYNPRYTAPVCLVPRYLRHEIPGRLSANGEEVIPLDLDVVEARSKELVEAGCKAIAICFLHSYSNHEHERRVAERVRQLHPSIAVAASHELIGEWREFERTSTTVLNAYVQPQFENYMKKLSERLQADGYSSPLAMMQSNGGVVAASRAATRPVMTLESGPAGGVIGAEALSSETGLKNLICFDVGGTTVDVALIDDGEIIERSQSKVAGRPVMGPTIDISSVGAGGGSIAWIDHRGALRVGPQSAGASPGPACFGHGGTELTVTDCHLLLGRLDAETFLGSRMKLDMQAAEKAMKNLADKIGLSVEETASGVLKIAGTNMTNAIRSITVERGLDPRDYSLLSYGGGGGLFAAAVSDELDVKSVIVPRAPANFSAWGIVTSDYREDSSHTYVSPLIAETLPQILDVLASLKKENLERLQEHGFDSEAIQSDMRADVRYAGQEFTVTVAIDEKWTTKQEELLQGVRERFVELHRRLYGHGEAAKAHSTRDTYFSVLGKTSTIPVFNRDDLVCDQEISGPAIVEEWTTTTVIPPNWNLVVDRIGNLILTQSS